MSKQGEVKVVDFGLAKATSQVEVTDPGVVKGKMSYLSPEAARGEEVDSRADIFAVGILLYEMLTGKRLFYGETDYQTVELVRNAKIPPLRPQNPQVEPELEDIVRKALAKRKEDRFQSATDLQDALAQYSYSRGLKVISRDIAELVRQCLDDKRMQSGEGKRPSIAEHILQGELVKFTSVDFEDQGAQPLTADELAPRVEAPAAPPDGDFVDPRGWADERLPAGNGQRRDARARVTTDLARRAGHGARCSGRHAPPNGCGSRPGRTARPEIHRRSPRPPSRRRAPKRWPTSSSRCPGRRRPSGYALAPPRRRGRPSPVRTRGAAFSSAR